MTTVSASRKLSIVLAAALMALVSCKKHDGRVYDPIKPSGSNPSWGPDITPQMLTVIEALDSLGAKPIHTLSVEAARSQPTPADAVKKVMSDFGIVAPAPKVDTTGAEIPVDGGTIHGRIYTPTSGRSSYPVLVYYHGGGWVIATIDTYNASAQALAEKTDAIVVAVEYRKGPEFKFPTAHKDAFAAYKWTRSNASGWKGDTSKIAVVGESAGGNMAIAVSMMARDSAVAMPKHIVSVYPVASKDSETTSKKQYVMAQPLSAPDLPWFLGYYLASPADVSNPWLDLVNANLTGLPGTTIIAAEIDPLQTEGRQLADKLQAAAVPTTYHLYNGVTHEFFGMGSVVPEAGNAEELASRELNASFK